MPQEQTDRRTYINWMRSAAARRPLPSEQRRARAWEVARQAAEWFRKRYGVTRVRVFGSLLHPERFHTDSDIDLAVEGLTTKDYWDAMADAYCFDDEMTIDVVDPDACPAPIWAVVEKEGADI